MAEKPRQPTSVVEDLLGDDSKTSYIVRRAAAPKLPDLNPEKFNKFSITDDLGGIYAFAKAVEEEAQKSRVEGLSGDEFAKRSATIKDKIIKVQNCLKFYQQMGVEHNIQYREADKQEFNAIRDFCDRSEAMLFDQKVKSQIIPTLGSITDPWLKKALEIPEKIDYKLDTAVVVYDAADLGEVNKAISITKGFEHNAVFTGVFGGNWLALSEKEKMSQVKILVRVIGQRMHKVRLVDKDGNLLGECRSRSVSVF